AASARCSGRSAVPVRTCAAEMKPERAANSVCSLPNQTPACRGLVTFNFAGSGQARSRLGEGWGGGSFSDAPVVPHRATPTPNPSPQGGGERTECAGAACLIEVCYKALSGRRSSSTAEQSLRKR